MEDLLDNTPNRNDHYPASVPNAAGVLVLGILSIVTCWLYALPGIACGIIAVVLHQKDKRLYLSNPAKYEQSFKTSKGGFVCAVIGLSISGLFLLFFLLSLFAVIGSGISRF